MSGLPTGSLLQYADPRRGVLLPRGMLALQLRPVPHPGAPRYGAPVPELSHIRWPISTIQLIDDEFL